MTQSQVKGVSYIKASGKWRAKFDEHKVRRHVGTFDTRAAAEAALLAERAKPLPSPAPINPENISIPAIIRAVADDYGFTVRAMVGAATGTSLTEARYIVYWIANAHELSPAAVIGHFGLKTVGAYHIGLHRLRVGDKDRWRRARQRANRIMSKTLPFQEGADERTIEIIMEARHEAATRRPKPEAKPEHRTLKRRPPPGPPVEMPVPHRGQFGRDPKLVKAMEEGRRKHESTW